MRTINNLLQAIDSLDLLPVMEKSIIDTKADYIRIQKEQLKQGARSDGAFIFNLKTGSDEYSPAYARYKGKSQPIDLFNTGAFYGGIDIEPAGNGENVCSNDEKSDMLQKTYGKKIFGLATESKTEYKEYLQPAFVESVKAVLNR